MNKRIIKRAIAIFITISCLCLMINTASANQYIDTKSLRDIAFSEQYSPIKVFELTKKRDNSLENASKSDIKTLNDYSSLLELIYKNKPIDNYADIMSNSVFDEYVKRMNNIKDFAVSCNQQYTDSAVNITITKADYNESITKYSVYEWCMIEYNQGGYTDYCGFGFDHILKIKDGRIIEDIILNDSFTPKNSLFIAEDNSDNTSIESISYNSVDVKATYSAKKAVEYADKYALNYNPEYTNMNKHGGDCANFVSQCLYAGGIPMTDGWYYNNGWSSSWSFVPDQIAYFSKLGQFIKNPDNSKVLYGNPVYYYSSSTSKGAHAAICVGVNESGSPIVNAHNNDRYHVYWTLGGEKWFPGGNSTVLLNDKSATTTKPTTIGTTSLNPNGKKGDANFDGKINIADVLTLRKVIARRNVSYNPILCDVTNDDKINIKDVLILRKYIVGIDVSEYMKSDNLP